jgi:hypothetical protein
VNERLADRGIAPGIAAAIDYSKAHHDLRAYALRCLFQSFGGYRFPPEEKCGGCERSRCEECDDLRAFYANGDWRAQEPWYWETGMILMAHCAPGIAAAAACYELMNLNKDWDMPEPRHLEEFTTSQFLAIALCELAGMTNAFAPRPWTALFLGREGPVREIEGRFAELCERDGLEVLRSCLAGTVTLRDGEPHDADLLFLISRERSGDRSELVEFYASLIGRGELAEEYGAWLSGELAPSLHWDSLF